MTGAHPDFSLAAPSPRAVDLHGQMLTFMAEHVLPAEADYLAFRNQAGPHDHHVPPVIEQLKKQAQSVGLWNLFLPSESGLTQLEYAPIAELSGWSNDLAPEAINCQAPDTGNMELLHLLGTPAQQRDWLEPLLAGHIRSAFAMTEPDVASSDATNIATRIVRDTGGQYVIDGHKWWISGAGDPRCAVFIVMGKTDPAAPRHAQQSMILVPADTPGITIKRPLPVFGYDDAPHGHCEILFENVRVPAANLLLGEGRGFEIAQGRLGPGRIHHCMRAIGVAERALELMCRRLNGRVAFGRKIADQGVWRERIAESRIRIDTARLLTLKTASLMDTVGNKHAKAEIAMIKVLAPNVTQQVLDWAIQAYGAAGVSDDFPLANQWAGNRTLRLADGPDEVHRNAIAKLELARYQ